MLITIISIIITSIPVTLLIAKHFRRHREKRAKEKQEEENKLLNKKIERLQPKFSGTTFSSDDIGQFAKLCDIKNMDEECLLRAIIITKDKFKDELSFEAILHIKSHYIMSLFESYTMWEWDNVFSSECIAGNINDMPIDCLDKILTDDDIICLTERKIETIGALLNLLEIRLEKILGHKLPPKLMFLGIALFFFDLSRGDFSRKGMGWVNRKWGATRSLSFERFEY